MHKQPTEAEIISGVQSTARGLATQSSAGVNVRFGYLKARIYKIELRYLNFNKKGYYMQLRGKI